MPVTIEFKGLNKVIKAWTGYVRRLPKKATKRGMWLASLRLAKRLREAAPKGARGYMKSQKGTFAKKMKDGYAIMMPYYTDYVERRITRSKGIPARLKVLRWQRVKGKYIVGKLTTRAHPFTAATIQRTLPEIRKIIEGQMNNAIKKTSR